MLESLELDPAARVLVLEPPAGPVAEFIALLEHLAERLTEGSVVAMAEDLDAVAETRRALAARDNVMIVPAPASAIPWHNAFFTVVIDPLPGRTDLREIARVLAPGGTHHILGSNR